MSRTTVERLAFSLRGHRATHDRNDRENRVRVALIAHTGLQLKNSYPYKGERFSLMQPNGLTMETVGGDTAFTLEEIEQALQKAGINPHKK